MITLMMRRTAMTKNTDRRVTEFTWHGTLTDHVENRQDLSALALSRGPSLRATNAIISREGQESESSSRTAQGLPE